MLERSYPFTVAPLVLRYCIISIPCCVLAQSTLQLTIVHSGTRGCGGVCYSLAEHSDKTDPLDCRQFLELHCALPQPTRRLSFAPNFWRNLQVSSRRTQSTTPAATMATMLSSLLPAPVHNEEVSSSAQKQERELAAKSAQLSLISHRSKAPPYGSRKGWLPSKPEDYGDGGAL